MGNCTNIRINSKINPERDIVEYLEWESAWEQLFTLDAAKRELAKQWKRLPDNGELEAIIEAVWEQELAGKPTGRHHTKGVFQYTGTDIYFLTDSKSDYQDSTDEGGINHQCNMTICITTLSAICGLHSPGYGLSVRAVMDI